MNATAQDSRAAWVAERKQGLGGSDMRDLFQIENEGCLRRLWFDKRDVPTDHPDEDTLLLRRGRVLEDIAAQEYALRTGRRVVRAPHAVVREDTPWARVNIDRRLQKTERPGPAPLEIKTAGSRPFQRIKREGMKPAHILQLQHALWVSGAQWGAFAVLHPDSWQMVYFDVDRDDAIIAAIGNHGHAFWYGDLAHPEPPAAPYGPKDAPCRNCLWRQRCHGDAAAMELELEQDAPPLELAEDLDEIVDDYAQAKAAADEANATLELVKDALKRRLGDRGAVRCATGVVYYTEQKRKTVDVGKLRKAYPQVAGECERIQMTRPLRVYAQRRPREE